jgi:hypothetical protein
MKKVKLGYSLFDALKIENESNVNNYFLSIFISLYNSIRIIEKNIKNR